MPRPKFKDETPQEKTLTQRIRDVENVLNGRKLHATLSDFVAWYDQRRMGDIVKPIVSLAGTDVNLTESELHLTFPTSGCATHIFNEYGPALQKWAGRRTVLFDYQTPTARPACLIQRNRFHRKLGLKHRYEKGPCTCYSCGTPKKAAA